MSFRLPLFIQAVIGSLLFFGSFLLPESPRHLFASSQPDAGRAVLCQLRGLRAGDEALEREVAEIEEVVAIEEKEPDRSYKALWRRYKGRVLIAMSAQAGAQLNGINVISYYAPLVFERAYDLCGRVLPKGLVRTFVADLAFVRRSRGWLDWPRRHLYDRGQRPGLHRFHPAAVRIWLRPSESPGLRPCERSLSLTTTLSGSFQVVPH